MSDAIAMNLGAREEPLDERLVAEVPALRAYVRRLVGSRRGEVEDVVQEVLARALKYRTAFDRERALGPWLRRTALRAFLDQRAKLVRAPERLDGDARSAQGDVVELAEQRESLERALVRLSDVERDIVLRFHSREESIEEIARALDMPSNTVKSHLHRARAKLAEVRP